MTIDTNTMVSISEANQNFSKVARMRFSSNFEKQCTKIPCYRL